MRLRQRLAGLGRVTLAEEHLPGVVRRGRLAHDVAGAFVLDPGTLEVVERVPYPALPEGERTEAVELVGESNRFVELFVEGQGPASEFEPSGIAKLLEA